jgi:Bacterial TniB protein
MSEMTPFPPDEEISRRRAQILEPKFIRYSAAEAIFNDLTLIYNQKTSLRPRNYLLISNTGNGKTSILHEFAKRYPGSDCAAAESLERPVLVVECPPKGNLLELYRSILRRLNTPFNARSSAAVLFDTVLKMVRACKVRLLVIDEFHSLISQKMILSGADDFLNQLKYIMNELRLPIVCAGIETAERVAKHDPQIWNRFNVGRLPPWKPDANSTINLLKTLENKWGLKNKSDFANPELLKYIYKQSNGQIGDIIERLEECAVAAVGTTECITLATLKPLWDGYIFRKHDASQSKPE